MTPLWPHQAHGFDLLRRSLMAGKRRPMLQAPTGSGKTLLAAAIVDGARRKGNRVIFTVPALELIDQTVTAFWDEGIREIGVIQADHMMTDWSQPVQIASVQTLQRRQIPKADVVVVDEAHRWFSFYGEWMDDPEWARIPFIGLSATPWTRGLGKHYDDLIVVTTTGELIEKGLLSKFRVFAPSHPDLSEVRTVAGDYHEGDLSEVMDQSELTADVVQTWKRLGEGRSTLCFAVDRAHAKRLQGEFQAAGVPTGYIDAYTPDDERKTVRNAFHSGTFRVVCNVNCLTMGVDWDVRCIILARPTKSEILFVQQLGRGLRTAEGKEDCIILDHSDSHLRLGFVTDIHHDHLDDGSPRQKALQQPRAKLPKECPQCHFVKPAKVHQCPACGFAPERMSDIETVDGELVELKGKAKREDKQAWFSMLLMVAQQKGYRSGWAANQYRQKFGAWPRGLVDAPVQPSGEVISWIRSRQIAWAKSKKNPANQAAA